jgi:hypothetical protein
MFEPGGNWDMLSSMGTTTGSVNMVANANGSVTATIDTSALNGFAWVPFSPDAILTTMSVTASPDGFVSVHGSRSSYPSMEIWTYQTG